MKTSRRNVNQSQVQTHLSKVNLPCDVHGSIGGYYLSTSNHINYMNKR